ncbi:MAG: hypothetical protein ACP5L4_06345 [Thermoplasmata archaeon]
METAIREQNVAMQENEEKEAPLEERIQNIEVQIANLNKKTIWERIKELIVGYIIAIVMFAISWYLVGPWAILIAVILVPVSFFYTKYIFRPPFTPIFIVGHRDPDKPESMVIIDAWGIPDEIMDEIDLTGVSTPISTPWGVGYLAEGIKFDENGKVSSIVFAWPHNNELNFLTKHSIFHYVRQENYLLAKAYNFTKMLLHGMALRIGFEYASFIAKYIGDEKIAKGLKGIEDERQLTIHIEEVDQQLRELRKKYGFEEVIDKDEANLVPEG